VCDILRHQINVFIKVLYSICFFLVFELIWYSHSQLVASFPRCFFFLPLLVFCKNISHSLKIVGFTLVLNLFAALIFPPYSAIRSVLKWSYLQVELSTSGVIYKTCLEWCWCKFYRYCCIRSTTQVWKVFHVSTIRTSYGKCIILLWVPQPILHLIGLISFIIH